MGNLRDKSDWPDTSKCGLEYRVSRWTDRQSFSHEKGSVISESDKPPLLYLEITFSTPYCDKKCIHSVKLSAVTHVHVVSHRVTYADPSPPYRDEHGRGGR